MLAISLSLFFSPHSASLSIRKEIVPLNASCCANPWVLWVSSHRVVTFLSLRPLRCLLSNCEGGK